MYFGSVRFFKHLILTVTALLIIVPTVLCILLAVDNGKKSDEIDRLNSQLSAQSQVSQISDDQSRTSSATESSDNVKAEPSVTESVKPETSAAVPETTKAPETTPASSSAVESTDSSLSSGADSYTSLFPTLYADKYEGEYENSENTVYLTFDDGPSVLTENLLYYLRQENVKATFFVVPERTEYCYSLLREISNAGHTIGIHSASHDYEKIYASVDAFLEDFNEAYEIVLEATGKAPDIYSNDWQGYGWTTLYTNVLKDAEEFSSPVILFHNTGDRDNTVLVIEDIIKALKNKGYKFGSLSQKIKPVQF